MSDYQTITVQNIEASLITIEVIEHDASRAISSILDEGEEERGIKDGKERSTHADWLKIGAMLLLDQKAREGDIPLIEDELEPESFVVGVTLVEATPIGKGDADNTIYQAVLRLELKHAEHAECFEVGETFGAAADLGGDFEDLF